MALLKDQDREHLLKEFEALQDPVKIMVFTQENECQYCAETRQIAEEVAGLSDNISVEVFDFVADQEVAEHYNIDKTFKDFLSTRVDRKSCSEKLKSEILVKIREIDEAGA